MKQLAQNIRTGDIAVVDVSVPRQEPGKILVKVYSSALSPGTEKTTIDNRRSSLLSRARSQPEEVRKVVDEIRRTGFTATYKRVRNKLESTAPLGYSNAGIVLAVDPSIQDIEIGDRVACAGAEYAFHSDVIAVPRNLLVKIPDPVPLDYAAFTTLGAIALQGIRQTSPTLGETIAVIGLGIIGQLTVQMLKANGCKVIGIDIDPNTLVEAEKSGADIVLHRNNDPVESTIESVTKGIGADAVIITAGTSSNDPVTLAGRICRERGRVTIVGAVGMDIPRSVYYKKELEVRLSRSYGPGRYNVDYEKKGQDFPPAYVRWTMNRNMQAFVQFIAEGKVAMKDLITHTFSIDEAQRAYELIAGDKTEFYLGILLRYEDLDRKELHEITEVSQTPPATLPKSRSPLCVGFIGAGSFATGYLIPHLQKIEDLTLEGICNRTGLTAADVRNKFGFIFSTTDEQDILSHERIGTVFIATSHGSHFRWVK
ncbi:MAG: zinc-binding dehydrogenase, partial [Chlorobi bacterium]|nr:zinc-binding dehydrogenase [Chlorobiota bacterium]